jgi:hypothetical protein
MQDTQKLKLQINADDEAAENTTALIEKKTRKVWSKYQTAECVAGASSFLSSFIFFGLGELEPALYYVGGTLFLLPFTLIPLTYFLRKCCTANSVNNDTNLQKQVEILQAEKPSNSKATNNNSTSSSVTKSSNNPTVFQPASKIIDKVCSSEVKKLAKAEDAFLSSAQMTIV